MGGFELTFNWFYADSKHIAMYSSGRLPLRAPDVEPRPADERRRVVRVARLARADVAPARRRPAERRDRQLEQQAGGRVRARPTTTGRTAPCTASQLLNSARRREEAHAGERRRRDERRGDAGSARDARPSCSPTRCRTAPRRTRATRRCSRCSAEWDGSRLDANLDGKIDAPGAAIMDAWWPKLAVAVLQPQLGPLTDDLKRSHRSATTRTRAAARTAPAGTAYVDKDRASAARRAGDEPVLDALRQRRPSRRARRRSGTRSTRPGNALAAAQGADPAPGAPTRRRSGSTSPASSPTRCAGRTARPSSR